MNSLKCKLFPGLVVGLTLMFGLAGLIQAQPASGQSLPQALFIQPESSVSTGTLPIKCSAITRQRQVGIAFSALAQATTNQLIKLTLNLFDDLTLTAILTSGESGSLGTVWTGYIEGSPESRVLLVQQGESLTANIHYQGQLYEVRVNDLGLHKVREVDPSKLIWTLDIQPATVNCNETEVHTLTNQEREKEGLHGLSYVEQLFNAARAHSVDMATRNFFSHTNPDGLTPSDRIAAAGYPGSYVGENIAAGYSTPEETVTAWMNSSGHRANILNSTYCDLGVGYSDGTSSSQYKTYWTQNFGRQDGVSSCPSTPTEPPDCEGGGGGGGGTVVSDDGGGGCFIAPVF